MPSIFGHFPQISRELSVEEMLERVLASLESDGFAVIDDWLTPEETEAIRVETLAAQERGELSEARIGRGDAAQRITGIRSDVTRWWEPEKPSTAQRPLVEKLERLREALNRHFFLALRDWEGHSAVYEPGSFYRKHLDRFRGDDRRTVSVVVYFNPDWKKGDGGELRIWRSEDDANPLDIAPLSGRAVIFFSDRTPHEVIAAQKRRISFAGWLRRA